jgi:hypothetical protein
VLSASPWKTGALAVEFRQPSGMLIDTKAALGEKTAIEANTEDRKTSLPNFPTATNDGASWQAAKVDSISVQLGVIFGYGYYCEAVRGMDPLGWKHRIQNHRAFQGLVLEM